jgi:mycofactocin system glycosyltransferase
MTAKAAALRRPSAGHGPGDRRSGRRRTGGGVRYALQPGVELVPDAAPARGEADGGVLLTLRPLMAMRFNGAGFALIAALAPDGGTAEEAARRAGVSPVDAAAFLDRLAERRLVSCSPVEPRVWPRISIIVAARGRHHATRACVESLLALDYPGEPPEIIIVDDASDPPLASALTGLPIRLLRLEQNVGQSAARNLAAAEAAGDVLAFTDNDCIADRDWLRTLVPYFGDPATAIVGGRVLAPPPTGPVASFEAVRSPLDMGPMAGRVGPDAAVAYLPTCNFLVRRDVLLAQGGFAAEMRVGEDVDFCWRVLRAGRRAFYAPVGRVIHDHRVRLAELLRRRADYGSSEADLQWRHPAGRRVLFLPKLSLLVLAMLTALGVAEPVAAALGLLIVAMLAVETSAKHRTIRRLGIALPGRRIITAVLREHAASLYGLSANTIRYYGLPLLVAALAWSPLWPAAAILLLLAPIIDHRRLSPSMSMPAFVGLYWLEMAAYQLGVWRGCVAHRAFHPLLPILRWRR